MKLANAYKLDRKSGGTLWRTWGTVPFLFSSVAREVLAAISIYHDLIYIV
jgi:hypothetical protein